MTSERRRAWRYPVNIDVKLRTGKGLTRDISSSGLFFETEEPLVPGQPLKFSFTLDNVYPDVRLELHCVGRVVRVERRDRRLGAAVTIDSWTFEPQGDSETPAGRLPETRSAR